MNRADSDNQWMELESIWKQQPVNAEIPAAILKWVRRQERRMRLVVAFEWFVTLGVGIFYAVKVILSRNQPDNFLVLVFALSMLTLIMGFATANRRGLWAPLEESAKAYVELGLLRLKRKRGEVYFNWFFWWFQILLIFLWKFARPNAGSTEPLIRNPQEVLIILTSCMIFLVLHSIYVYRRTGKEKMALENFQEKYLN
ncbi:hypothetical protein [Microbulbifer epialgicus]|uniref:Uncharacterized protein n=1 Tax=Microbulbifer epialgicus TaxID=393907 RepID=A0ABV4P6X0_9GAMM